MNFKQKLTYMLIGSLFTLTGYFFASLGGSALQTTHAQQNEKVVIDDIVCRRIHVVDSEGEIVVSIGANGWGGMVNVFTSKQRKVPAGNSVALIWADKHGGKVFTRNNAGKTVTEMGADLLGMGGMSIYNTTGKREVEIAGGGMSIYNATGKCVVDMGGLIGIGGGNIMVSNKDGKELVYIGAIKGRPNDGLINVYNHKGEWRSFSKD